MRRQRGLTPEEVDLWTRVARTVRPLHPQPKSAPAAVPAAAVLAPPPPPAPRPKGRVPVPLPPPVPRPADPRALDRHGLDASWEKKLTRTGIDPDFTLDLHGHSLAAAHSRLDHGLSLAMAQRARVVLVITGLPRAAEAADRGDRRGAIRAKLIDWLAAGPHASRIAAVRGAHRRHGGAGAVYVILKRLK
jgi:DNA-nicking Smr family endonuclease